jgi:Uma2 family endonuclease
MLPDAQEPPESEVVYPVFAKRGKTWLKYYIIRELTPLLEDFLAAQGRQVMVGADQFFYYRRGDPRANVSPDVYVITDEPAFRPDVGCWKVWEHDGKVPSLALEVVSGEYLKDYSDVMIERYEQLGVRELVRYDPEFALRSTRQLMTHWVRDADGRLAPRPSPADRVRSVCFGFWIVRQANQSLRLGLDPDGGELWPTVAERARAEAAAAKAAAGAAGAAAAAAAVQAQAAERERNEAELARLRAELARLRGG